MRKSEVLVKNGFRQDPIRKKPGEPLILFPLTQSWISFNIQRINTTKQYDKPNPYHLLSRRDYDFCFLSTKEEERH